jgi:hypothetical protein
VLELKKIVKENLECIIKIWVGKSGIARCQRVSNSDYRIPCRYVTAAGPHEQPKPDTLPQTDTSRPKLTKKSWKGDGKPALVVGWGDDSKAADGKGVILYADTCDTTDTSSSLCQPRQLAIRIFRCLKSNSIARYNIGLCFR